MDLQWPLVGRGAEVERVTSRLASGSGAVVLAGSAGVGKTRLATECLAAAASAGYVPLRVAATAASASLPFGAFAELLPQIETGTSRPDLLRQVARSIVEQGHGTPVALMVDDAHLLDEASAALTHQLALGNQSFLLTTIRTGEPALDAVVALWKDGLAERLEVRPLDGGSVRDLLEAALGAPVNGATVHLLLRRTEGNVLYLRELVLAALDSGALHRDEGVWRLSGELPTSSRLIEIVETRLGALDEQAREGLEILALGEPLEVELARRTFAGIDLVDLERRGLVNSNQEGRRLSARLHHPLYAEVLRARLSPLRRRMLQRSLGDVLEGTGSRRREDVLRLATWRLGGGGSISPELMLQAADAARDRHDLPLAERLAHAAVEAGAGFEAELLLGQIYWHQGRAAEAEEYLRTLNPATDAHTAMLASTRVTVLDMGLKRAEEALRVAQEAAETISDTAFRDQVDLERGRILGRNGHHASATELIRPILKRATGRTFIAAALAAGTSMPLTGRITEAIEATKRGTEVHLTLTGPPWTFSPRIHTAFEVFALWHAGYLKAAWDLGMTEYEGAVEGGALDLQGFFSVMAAGTALTQGRVATAARWAAQAAGIFRQIGIPMQVRNSLYFVAHSLALRQFPDEAEAVLAEIDALAIPPMTIMGPEVLRARAWTEVAKGDLLRAFSYLEQAIAMARSGGALVFESSALHDFARLGRPAEVVSRAEKIAGMVEGPLAPARSAYATALVRGDALALLAASRDFEQIGATLFAAEAAADASVAWRRDGEARKATGAERRSAALAARCEGARTPSLAVSAPARAVLTAREMEISRLAAMGLSSKQIAERLFLSHRTVENKLQAAYEKLGVQSRSELKEALASV